MEIVQAAKGAEANSYLIDKRKEDALDLALLIYDIYTDKDEHDNVHNGQNNANHNNETV